MNEPYSIAIVGLGGLFPDAPDLGAFWRNIRAGRDAACPAPPERWAAPRDRMVDPAPGPDRALHDRCGLLAPFEPDLRGLRVDRERLADLDPLFRLTLHVGAQAWRSARTDALDPRRVGVFLAAIALPTDGASAWTRSVHHPVAGPADRATDPHAAPAATNLHAVGLPAAWLADALGLRGPSLTLDAACASSLYALKLACDELTAGRLDAVLTGGVSRPECLYTQVGFSQLQALSRGGTCRPFDARADGLIVGEGGGMFVLKRLADAQRDGDVVHGVIRAIGLSNDTAGSLLAPDSEGQLRALRAAYAQARWSPRAVQLIECHGTGTPHGDAVELASLGELWRSTPPSADANGPCTLGAVKANVGHTLTAAGAAGLLKVLLAMRAGELPPAANFEHAPPGAELAAGPFLLRTEPAGWSPSGSAPRRAAVSAFGFGGINAHLLVEQSPRHPQPASTAPLADTPPTAAPSPAIAVVSVAARVGTLPDFASLRAALFDPDTFAKAATARIDAVRLPRGRFRLPPNEAPDLLPQQLLMLEVAAAALDDAGLGERSIRPRAGLFVGVALDPNTSNYHLRWTLPESEPLRDTLPPLTAPRVLGALAGIVASRLAREFGFGGPCFTLSAGTASGLRALAAAVTALERRELDLALVGAVDLAGDPRWTSAGCGGADGAAALLLKRLDDARADGDSILAIIERPPAVTATGNGTATELEFPALNAAGAAAGLLSVTAAIGCLCDRVLPPGTDRRAPAAWLHDAADGPRRAVLRVTPSYPPAALDTSTERLLIVEHPRDAASLAREPAITRRPAGAAPAVFAVGGRDAAALLHELQRLSEFVDQFAAPADIHTLAAAWTHSAAAPTAERAVTLLAATRAELNERLEFARQALTRDPQEALTGRDDVFYEPDPARLSGEVAFVFPGSGNHEPGMGRQLALHWPAVVAQLEAETGSLRSQLQPERFWHPPAGHAAPAATDVRDTILAQVAYGVLAADVLRSIGLQPAAALGYSLGETTALFALRAWADRDEMFRRLHASPLFTHELAGEHRAARREWRLPPDAPLAWRVVAVPRDAAQVRAALAARQAAAGDTARAWLLIVNAPGESVIGGDAPAVAAVIDALQCDAHDLHGAAAVHCPIVRHVAAAYRELHRLPVTPPPGLRFYSAAAADHYELSPDAAAESITWQALEGFDFPRLIRQAYADGVRTFIEVGPRGSCTRMIGKILADQPHLARAATLAAERELHGVFELAAALVAARVLPDLTGLYPPIPAGQTATRTAAATDLVLPVRTVGTLAASGPLPRPDIRPDPQHTALPVAAASSAAPPEGPKHVETATLPAVFVETATRPAAAGLSGLAPLDPRLPAQIAAASAAVTAAHERFLAVSAQTLRGMSDALALQAELSAWCAAPPGPTTPAGRAAPPDRPLFDTAACFEFARGRIARVFGPDFAIIDTYPVRVRLPDEPLMLVHRVTAMDATPGAMTGGRITTEHDVRPEAWYLDHGRAPVCVSVEAGQADMFLASYLGIDFHARGLRSYRLLDAEIEFHRHLPQVGETIRYDIRIHRFVNNGEAWLFFFEFDATIAPTGSHAARVPLLTMRNGCAGFFTEEEIERSGGIVEDRREDESSPPAGAGRGAAPPLSTRPGPIPPALSAAQVDALYRGDLAAALGPAFAALPLREPVRLPEGKLHLVQRVVELDPDGGRWGRGLIRAEADIRPNDWFLTCHFIDDMVMPGTLMYECCAHTLRILLTALGWVGEQRDIHYEPVPGIRAKLRCRGPVTPKTRVVTYEVMIKEIGTGPEPSVIADAWMYADGRKIVRFTDMSMRLAGTSLGLVEALWRDAHAVKKFESEQVKNSAATAERSGPRAPFHPLTSEVKKCESDKVKNSAPTAERSGPPDDPFHPVTLSPFHPAPPERPEVKKCEGEKVKSSAASADRSALRDNTFHPLTFSPFHPAPPIGAPELPLGPAAAVYTDAQILAFAIGEPADAFGDRYAAFGDGKKRIARLPGPPYKFLDRITQVHATPWKLEKGVWIEAQYDVPPDAWYFAANRQPVMPFAVLLEIPLQACGWLAAHGGAALRSDQELSFRNLGGNATLYESLGPDAGTLTIRVRQTDVSQAGDMILVKYDLQVWRTRPDAGGLARPALVYAGDTQFGFFTAAALSNQVGIRDAAQRRWADSNSPRTPHVALPADAPLDPADPTPPARLAGATLPARALLMLDELETFDRTGGPRGLGFLRGRKRVDPDEWFFTAHFYQDPVCPGSLGLESFLQLLKVYMLDRWPHLAPTHEFEPIAVGRPHTWVYRGQIIRSNRLVTVEAAISAIEDGDEPVVTANGFLLVDGKPIYEMRDFALRLVRRAVP